MYSAPRDLEQATALLSVRDCAGDGIAGATVTLDPPAQIVYQGGGAATNGTGVAYALGVQAGSVGVDAGGAPFTFEVGAGELGIIYLVAIP